MTTDALPSAIAAWKRQFPSHMRCEMTLTSRRHTCTQIALSVNGNSDTPDVCVRQLAELLRLVELMTRPGVDPRALHVLTVGSDTCPVDQNRCAYCDDVDGRVVVALRRTLSGWHDSVPFPAIVRGALFEWNEETMASPEYTHLRDMLLRLRASALATTRRTRPVELSIDIACSDRSTEFEDLQSLLHQLRDSAAAMLEGFRLESLCAVKLSQRAADLLAACHLPIRAIRDWHKVGFDEKGDVRLLNMTVLEGDAKSGEHTMEQLYQLVRAHASQLKSLKLRHGRQRSIHGDQQLRETEVQTIGRSVFAPDSPLRLDYLEIMAPLAESDLQLMLAPLESTATDSSHHNAATRARHRVFDLTTSHLSTIQGATLGRLLMTGGGVESLTLFTPASEGLSIAQISPLLRSCPSLRSLSVEISCNDWASIPENVSDASISMTSLTITIKNDATVGAIDRLLSVVGHSLESLSILLTNARPSSPAELAAAIARRCPKLEELRVRGIDERFLATLVESYATQAFGPKRLALSTGLGTVDFVGLITALATPTHPMARVLRSLQIDTIGHDYDDLEALRDRMKRMLHENRRLQYASLMSEHEWPPYESDNWASQLPPLRHRLAALSALRRLQLPVDILTHIVTLAGRPIPRFE